MQLNLIEIDIRNIKKPIEEKAKDSASKKRLLSEDHGIVHRDEGASDIESGPEEGPELMPYGSFRLAPKIAVEHIYAWRRPLTREDKAKEL